MGKDSSLDGACERSIQIDDSKSNHRTTSCKKASKMPRKNKLPVSNYYIRGFNRKGREWLEII